MVNALDTHRMLYRNAVLRAYDASNPTTRVNFFNGDVDIGDEVYTNENGYLFYESGGRQPIECLNVAGNAIIKVSVDGGHNFDITWQVEDKSASFVNETDIHNMTYRGSDGTRKTWQVLQADCNLPDYLLKAEYHTGIWGEQEIAIGANTGIITLNEWAHVITILNSAPDNISITNVRLRAGQAVTIVAKKDCILSIVTGQGPGETFTVYKDCTYILTNRYNTESTEAGLALIQVSAPTIYIFDKGYADMYSDDGDTTVKVDIAVSSPVGCFPIDVNVIADATKDAWASKSLWLKFNFPNGSYQLVDTTHDIRSVSPYSIASRSLGFIWRVGDTYMVRL